ncbi:DUF1349 domain-containing protein [Microbacterium sp. 18062]|uniref:DUF1349 domain-containing protein n=1 Tax=Microbacterium sp. 18062 TaxID=2681410 RepID=UPI00135AF83B|nr:DUF1349 domain-containing protein [Microbacterium sp. 18062]
MSVRVPGLPELSWTHGEGDVRVVDDTLILTSAGHVDWTNDATGRHPFQHAATSLGFAVDGDFVLSARVRVPGRRTTFDAGALTLWSGPDHWAKLCFELSPQGEAMIVSVVTNRYSDDVDSTVVADDHAFLRLARIGEAYVFHSSSDGRTWRFVRLFRMTTDGPFAAGLMAQSPLGERCVAEFADIRFEERTLLELRDGS